MTSTSSSFSWTEFTWNSRDGNLSTSCELMSATSHCQKFDALIKTGYWDKEPVIAILHLGKPILVKSLLHHCSPSCSDGCCTKSNSAFLIEAWGFPHATEKSAKACRILVHIVHKEAAIAFNVHFTKYPNGKWVVKAVLTCNSKAIESRFTPIPFTSVVNHQSVDNWGHAAHYITKAGNVRKLAR